MYLCMRIFIPFLSFWYRWITCICPCWQGLLFYQLAELQNKVRSDVSSEYLLRMSCASPDKILFDWGRMRLPRPLYGVGDAFAMEADDQFRKKRDAEVIY